MVNPRQLKAKLTLDAKFTLRNALDNMLSGLIEQNEPVYKSCLNCMNFDEQKEVCNYAKPPQRPPARIIAYACPRWLDLDEIPF